VSASLKRALTGQAPPRRPVCAPERVAVVIAKQTACFKEHL
jgi:hypothetical protein